MATQKVQLLATCVEAGRVFAFFSAGDVGFVGVSPSAAAPNAELPPPSAWTWVSAKGAAPVPLVKEAVASLGPQTAVLGQRLARRLQAGAWVVPPLPGSLPDPFLFGPTERTSWSLKLPASGRELVLGLAEAEELDFSFMSWSVSFTVEGAEMSPAERAQAAQFFFVSVARFLLGVGPEKTASMADGNNRPVTRDGPGLSVSFHLGKDLSPESLRRLETSAHPTALVHVELPSECANRCVFCQKAWDQTERVDVPAATVLDRFRHVLQALAGNGAVERWDLSVGGEDCLEATTLFSVLEMARAHPKLDQLNLVTPGTRLGEPALVQKLRNAGVHRVSLSMLGPDEARHDALAGRPGAFAQLRLAIEEMNRQQFAYDLATVVVNESLPHLVETVELAYSLAGPVALYLYLADPTVPQARASLMMPRLDLFRELLESNRSRLEGKLRGIEHVPPCVLPPWARSLGRMAQRTHPDSVSQPPPPCAACAGYRQVCFSITKVYHALHGDAGLASLSAAEVEAVRTQR